MRSLLLVAILSLFAASAHAAPGIRTIYLVRHGMYDRTSNDDRAGNGLNALGEEQAAILGKFLAHLPVKITSLVSSDLRRAKETAATVGKALKMTPAQDPLLAECTATSNVAGMNAENDPRALAACDAQLEAAWAKYMRPSTAGDAHDVLVGHGNAIRWMVSKALAGSGKPWLGLEIANASLSILTVWPDGSTRLVMYDGLHDLPIEKQTWAGRGPGWKAK